MTDKTKKVLVSLFLCLVIGATAVLGVFAFIPNLDLGFGEYYQSPFNAIQKDGSFTDSVKATYMLNLDEDVEGASAEKVADAISNRLSKTYGYYGCDVEFNADDSTISITIPKTNNTNTEIYPSEFTILNGVSVNGNVEILNVNYSGASYSESSVLLKQEHFTSTGIRKLIDQGYTYFICNVNLTSEGEELAEALETNTPYTCAIDGAVETWVYWTGSSLQIYYVGDNSQTIALASGNASALSAYIQTGALNATLTQKGSTEQILNNLGWIYIFVFGLLALASFVFFVVRYHGVGLVPVLTQLLACFVFMFFGALVHLEIFNIAMGIGVILAYAFMSFFSAYSFEKVRRLMQNNKNYNVARYQALAFNRDNRKDIFISLIAHGALLLLGIIFWVIPNGFTAPLGNALVYGAVLSFVVTFCLNRLFARMVGVFSDGKKGKSRTK